MSVEKYTLPVWFVPVSTPPLIGIMSDAVSKSITTAVIILLPNDSRLDVFSFSNERHIHHCGKNSNAATAMITIGTRTICAVVMLAIASAGDVFIYNKGVLSRGTRQYP